MNKNKVSFLEKIGFSLGDTASNLFFQTFMLFLMYFYTDVFGIPAAAVGTMFLVTRVWDAVNDPVMGMIADRTNTKWGKFRPYLLWLAIPYGLIGVLTFTTPGFDSTGKIVYAYISYSLMMMVYTAINVPYSALMGVITPNSEERTVLSSFRFVAAFAGGFIVQAFTMDLVKEFGQGDEAFGWQIAMSFMAGLAAVLFIVTFLTTKERVHPPKEQKSKTSVDLKDLVRNIPWLLIAGATVFQLTNIVIRNSAIMYYFKYYIGSQDTTLFGIFTLTDFESTASLFMMIGTGATISGAILTKWISRLIDKKNTFSWFLMASSVLCILFVFLTPQDIQLIFIFQIATSFLLGPVAVLQWAMYTDTADYSEWKNGRRATALIMAASLFALKLGLTFGGAIVGWALAIYGFEANVEQTNAAKNGIVMLMSVFPGIAGLIGGSIMIFYPLTNRKMEQIESDLSARRKDTEE